MDALSSVLSSVKVQGYAMSGFDAAGSWASRFGPRPTSGFTLFSRAEINVPKDMLQLAEHILASKAGDFEPATFTDRYEEAVVAMLRTKQSGRAVSTSEPRFKDEKVFDLMEALRRSIAGTPKPAEALGKKTKAKPAKKRIEGQREMLLPISGKKAAEAKPAAKPTKMPAKRKAG